MAKILNSPILPIIEGKIKGRNFYTNVSDYGLIQGKVE
jgi:hypothetical protein